MRNVRRALKLLRSRGDAGEASSRVMIAMALGLVLVVAIYVVWSLATHHG